MNKLNLLLAATFVAFMAVCCQKNNSNNQNVAASSQDWHKTFFEQVRPPQDKATIIAQWKKDTFTNAVGWMEVKNTNIVFWAEDLDEFFSSYFDEQYDPEYAVKSDANGKYLIGRNGNRTVSFNEISFSHLNGNIGIGFVFFTAERYENEHAGHSKGTWLIFDRELTQCDTLDWHGSYNGGYALSDKGVWDNPGSGRLRCRTYTDLYSGYLTAEKIPESYQMEIEEKNGFYFLTAEGVEDLLIGVVE